MITISDLTFCDPWILNYVISVMCRMCQDLPTILADKSVSECYEQRSWTHLRAWEKFLPDTLPLICTQVRVAGDATDNFYRP
jgi:hypothetical protein